MGPSGRGAGFRLVVDRLYGIRDAGVQGAVRIDTKVIEHHLRRVYEAKNPTGRWIESGMYQAVRDVLEEAVNMGMGDGSQGRVPLDTGLSASLAHSAEVFSAFKVHRMQRDMARLLVDDQGNLRSFREWRELVTPISAHQVGPWLETEYSTAVLRAQQAVEWQQFEAEADVLPNLRWVPSTAVHPGADHQVFWNTILPIHHPFWDQHRPGDRWNCHCSLEATDEHPTAPPKGFELRGNGPQPGLNENPGKTGRLFAQSHPYFPQSCAQCAFYEPGQATQLKNAQGKCENCPFLQKCIDKAQPSPKGYTKDKEYGGRLLISNCADKSELEDNMRAARAILDAFPDTEIKIRQHVIEHGIKNPEYEINGLLADRKGIKSPNGVADGFNRAMDQGCKIVVLDLDKHPDKNAYLKSIKLSAAINNRHADFEREAIIRCYVVFNGRSVMIDKSYFSNDPTETKQKIRETLEKIKSDRSHS